MAEASLQLKDLLQKTRRDAQKALALLSPSNEVRSLAWKCSRCGHGGSRCSGGL